MHIRSPAPGGLAFVEELVNSLNRTTGADRLATAEGRVAFGLTEADLPAARELRESLRAACLAHAGLPPHATVTPLSGLLARAPLVVTVDETDGSATLAPVPASAPAPAGDARPDALASRVAAAIAEAVIAGTWTRLKACQAADCHDAFYDRSPAARSRWCSMAACGSRAKMRAYRARRA